MAPAGVHPDLPPPPLSEAELITRARALAGMTLGHLCGELGLLLPPDLARAKGWVGTLLERALGATASSRDVPDFEAIGVEMKSLPIDLSGKPMESTFVCTAPLTSVGESGWLSSRVRRKLARVLWLPVEADSTLALRARRIGSGFLWSPSEAEDQTLAADWQEIAGLIGHGRVDAVHARRGKALQLRPKAKSASSRTRYQNEDGDWTMTLPRGFYLRPSFTRAVLKQNFPKEAE